MADSAKANIGIILEVVVTMLVGLLLYQRQEDQIDMRNLRGDVVQIKESIASVTANRFTSGDGVEVWKAIAEIQAKIRNLPPEKWRERIEDIDSRLRLHEMDASDPSPPAPRR